MAKLADYRRPVGHSHVHPAVVRLGATVCRIFARYLRYLQASVPFRTENPALRPLLLVFIDMAWFFDYFSMGVCVQIRMRPPPFASGCPQEEI